MTKFSVVLIAKNEEDTLPRLLESIKGVDEVVLVDTGSTDNTAEVARKYGVRVFEEGTRFLEVVTEEMAEAINSLSKKYGEPNIVEVGDKAFNYSNARNYAASLASNDLIFMPDCDEVVTWDLPKLEEIITGKDILEYDFVFSHKEDGTPLVSFLHSKFYNRTKFKWDRCIHEILSGDGQRQYISPDIIKLDHFQNVHQNRDHYLRGLAIDNHINPYNDRQQHYYARELMYKNRFKSAIDVFEQHASNTKGWVIEQAQSLTHVGECYGYLGEIEKAKEAYLRAIQKYPLKREAFYNMGTLYMDQKQFHEAAAFYAAATQIPRPNFYACFAPMYEELPHGNLAIALWQVGKQEEAFSELQKALKFAPDNQQYLFNLRYSIPNPKVSIIVPTLGRPEKLQRLIKHIKAFANYPNYEIIVIHDGEDIQPLEGVRSFKNEERIGVPKTVKKAVQLATGDLVMYLGNDCIPQPGFMIQAVWDAYKAFGKDMNGLVSFNEGPLLPDNGNICAHFILHQRLIAEIGEVFDTEFHHVGCDNLLWAKASKLGKAFHSTNARLHHDHFSKGSEMDSTYKQGWSHVDEDRELLKKKLNELNS